MATSNTKFKIKPSPRTVMCRGCSVMINSTQLRIETVSGSGAVGNFHHPACLLGQPQGSSVQKPEDLDGWQQLTSQEQDSVRGLFPPSNNSPSQPRPSVILNNPNRAQQVNSRPSSQNALIDLAQGQGASSMPLNSQSQLCPLRRGNSRNSSNSQSQPFRAILSRTSSLTRSHSQRSELASQSQSSVIDLTDLDDSYDDYDEDYDGYDDEYDDYDEDSPQLSLSPKRPRLARDSQGNPVMPDLLAGVSIPEGRDRDGEECSVCLDPPLHPVTLPCGHVFCFTCAKGLTQGGSKACSLCRKDIPDDFLDNSQVISEALEDVGKDREEVNSQQAWRWFYEGRNGWWKFEERNNEEIEETFLKGTQCLETLICGNLYVIDFTRMEQYQKNYPNRKRKIKRDLETCDSKGIAGLHASKIKPKSQPGSQSH